MALPRTTLEQWAVLAAVIDEGGFAQAAEALHKSQSAVSYTVAKLQEALDVPLLVPEGRRTVLTEHGQSLLRRARRMISELSALEALARSVKQGWEPTLSLVIDAAFPRARLLNIVAELQALCPNTQLNLHDVILSGAEDAILEGDADVVVTSHVPAGFAGDFLMNVTFVAVAAPSHPLFTLEPPLTTQQLTGYTQCVVRDSGRTRPRDEGWLGANLRYTVSSLEAALATVEAGLTYAWLPEHLLESSLQRGAVQHLPLMSGATRKAPLSLVLVRRDIAGPAARAAVECFQRHVPASQADVE